MTRTELLETVGDLAGKLGDLVVSLAAGACPQHVADCEEGCLRDRHEPRFELAARRLTDETPALPAVRPTAPATASRPALRAVLDRPPGMRGRTSLTASSESLTVSSA